MSNQSSSPSPSISSFNFEIIGNIETIFNQKTGCPRQSLIVPKAKGRLLLKIGNNQKQNNSYHFVEGLEGFSHIWLFWIFHQNFHLQQPSEKNKEEEKPQEENNKEINKEEKQEEEKKDDNTSHKKKHHKRKNSTSNSNNNSSHLLQKAKIRPPRMNGLKVGALSCRAPYRPNPLGMSVVKLDKITKDEQNNAILHLSGVDLVNGTPIIDIKPYIPEYDMVMEEPLDFTLLKDIVDEYVMRKGLNSLNSSTESNNNVSSSDETDNNKKRKIEEEGNSNNNTTINNSTPPSNLLFAKIADWMENIPRKQKEINTVIFSNSALESIDKFIKKSKFYDNSQDVKDVIENLIQLDPRSKFRREKCNEEIFAMYIDIFNIRCKLKDNVAHVLEIEDWSNGCPYTKEELKERNKRDKNIGKEQ
ncbi:hypothetical protein ABK040_008882 [Willaertia magna]